MHPHDLAAFGVSISVWNAVFLVAVLMGGFVFRRSAAAVPELRFPMLRYAVFVYLSALAAQVFAYAFDANTSLSPPTGVTVAAWYLNPLAGPKTLFGVLVLAPASVAIATLGSRVTLGRGLDVWTPAILVVLATVRVGCLLQGCCFGVRSDRLGMSFPAGSPPYWQQMAAGLIAADAARSLPVVPTQALEAAFLGLLVLCSLRREREALRRPPRFPGRLFLLATTAYSVFRFVVEFARADAERGVHAGLATSQWIALVVLMAVAWVTVRSRGSARVPAAA